MKKDGEKIGKEKDRQPGVQGEERKNGSPNAGEESPFSILRRRTRDGNREGALKEGERKKDIPTGDAVLAALGGTQPRGPEAAGTPAPGRLDPALTDKLVDRILVSAPQPGGQAEVRISLREDVLPGTEVRIQRLPDGGVKVQFVTDNPQAERQLNQTQLAGLQQMLGENLRAEVRVSTLRTDGSMTSDSGSGGSQNRGGGGQDAQGDSRQRSSQYDLYGEEYA